MTFIHQQMSSSSVAAPLPQRIEDDAFRAYSLIQSLLNGDGSSPFGQSSPLQANELWSPLQAINTPSQQQVIDNHSMQLLQSTADFTGTSSRFSGVPLAGTQQSGHRGTKLTTNEQSLLYEEVPMNHKLPTENTFHGLLLNAIEPSPAGNFPR